MSCHECIYGREDDCNPNNFVCHCQRPDIDEDDNQKPNEHYLHILHANHSCKHCIAKDNCIGMSFDMQRAMDELFIWHESTKLNANNPCGDKAGIQVGGR